MALLFRFDVAELFKQADDPATLPLGTSVRAEASLSLGHRSAR